MHLNWSHLRPKKLLVAWHRVIQTNHEASCNKTLSAQTDRCLDGIQNQGECLEYRKALNSQHVDYLGQLEKSTTILSRKSVQSGIIDRKVFSCKDELVE